jgi:hypothetical protein
MYAHIEAFAIDKARAAIYEGIAIAKIQEWYARQERRVHARYNEANGLEQKREYDLIDSAGNTWEVKADNIALTSGRVFISQSLRFKSTADMVLYLIPPGAWIIPRLELLALATSGSDRVGDNQAEFGDYVPLNVFKEQAEFI